MQESTEAGTRVPEFKVPAPVKRKGTALERALSSNSENENIAEPKDRNSVQLDSLGHVEGTRDDVTSKTTSKQVLDKINLAPDQTIVQQPLNHTNTAHLECIEVKPHLRTDSDSLPGGQTKGGPLSLAALKEIRQVQTATTSDSNSAENNKLQPLEGADRHPVDEERAEARTSGALSPLLPSQGLASSTRVLKTSAKTAFSSALERALAGQELSHISKAGTSKSSAGVQEKAEGEVKLKSEQENELHNQGKDALSKRLVDASFRADACREIDVQKQPEVTNPSKALEKKPTDDKRSGQSLCGSELPKNAGEPLVKRPASATTHGPFLSGKSEDNKLAAYAVRPASASTYVPASDKLNGAPDNEGNAALMTEQRRLARERGRQVRTISTCAPSFWGVNQHLKIYC
jgi:hypothetical protein